MPMRQSDGPSDNREIYKPRGWANFGPPLGVAGEGYHLISPGRLTAALGQGRQLKAANCGPPSPEQRMPR